MVLKCWLEKARIWNIFNNKTFCQILKMRLRSLHQFHSTNIYLYVLIRFTLKDMMNRNIRENDPSCTLKDNISYFS
jgi:hypothetical protein